MDAGTCVDAEQLIHVSPSYPLMHDHALLTCSSVVPILLLIARSKLVLDFALTIHFLHLIVTSLYTHGVPAYWFWWALQAASAALMTSLGVWACQWRELRPINFGAAARAIIPPANGVHAEANGANDSGEGYSRGRGRGRGRDGSGGYEMVGMTDQGDDKV